jgi:predicted enzyme related to lactoylglutathione lyase
MVSHHQGYTSHALDEVRDFYTQILGFTEFNHEPTMNYLWIRTGTTSSLGFMPPMPGPPEDWRPPRESVLYFMVDDVDRAVRNAKARGAIFQQEPTDMPWGHRVATLKDPEGRIVRLAKDLKE